MTIDMTGVVALTTTYPKRQPLLLTTLGCAMASTQNMEYCVCHYGELDESTKRYLSIFAEGTNNLVTYTAVDDQASVASTKRSFNHRTSFTRFINLDDDLLTNLEIWSAFKRNQGSSEVLIVGVVDANGSRGYTDYDNKVYDYYGDVVAAHGEAKASSHFIHCRGLIKGYRWLSQLYCISFPVWSNQALWLPIEEAFKQRGLRGYDVMLEDRMYELGIRIDFLTGIEAIHVGLEDPFIGGNWSTAHTLVTDRVFIDDSK